MLTKSSTSIILDHSALILFNGETSQLLSSSMIPLERFTRSTMVAIS